MPTQPSWYNASLLAVEEEETEGLQVILMVMMVMMVMVMMVIAIGEGEHVTISNFRESLMSSGFSNWPES